MQIFVKRADLTGQADEIVYAVATYDDATQVDPAAYDKIAITVFILPPTAVQIVVPTPPANGDIPLMPVDRRPTLVKSWRMDYVTQIPAGEAGRRIYSAFPDYSQMNSNNEMNGYITQYGNDSSKWPSAAQNRKAEIDRCWTYVNAVRASANAMAQQMLPVDPTADGHWPTIIPPYQPS